MEKGIVKRFLPCLFFLPALGKSSGLSLGGMHGGILCARLSGYVGELCWRRGKGTEKGVMRLGLASGTVEFLETIMWSGKHLCVPTGRWLSLGHSLKVNVYLYGMFLSEIQKTACSFHWELELSERAYERASYS